MNGVEVSFLALLAGFGSPDLFSTSCHGKAMVTSGRPVDAGCESMVYLVAGAPIYREELERLQALYLFSVFRLDKFWCIGCLQRRALESNSWKFYFRYQRHSADAVITCLFMPCVPRFRIITSRKLTCTFSLRENNEHQRVFFSTFTGTKHSQLL